MTSSLNSRDSCGTKACLGEETSPILRLYEVWKVRTSLQALLGFDRTPCGLFLGYILRFHHCFKLSVDYAVLGQFNFQDVLTV